MPGNQQLQIKQLNKQKLSKNQVLFNAITKKIATLQAEIAKKKLLLDTALSLYSKNVYPLKKQLLNQRETLIITLWKIYTSNKLSKADQRNLKKLIQYHLDQFLEEKDATFSAAIQEILEAIEGINYQQIIEEEKEKNKAEMKAEFAKIDIDLTEEDFENENKMAEKIALAREKMKTGAAEDYQWQQQKRQQKKSARQINYEKKQQEIEDLKKKNIGTIYKQLAKLFHPDLEQDALKKAEKEALMKTLTAAYEAKDLHTLLMLELKWIHQQQNQLADIADDKMSIYLAILNEQKDDLINKKNQLILHPQYSVLADEFGYHFQKYPLQIIQKETHDKQQDIQAIEQTLQQLNTENALKEVKSIIKKWVLKDKKDWEEAAMFDAFWN